MKNKTAFVDIDTQFDFMDPRGRLYVPGAEYIIDNIKKLFRYAKEHKIKILSSTDSHTVGDPEFQNFPPHCVKGTPGNRKIEETVCKNSIFIENKDHDINQTTLNHDQIIIEKSSLDIFDNTNIDKVITQLDAGDFVVFGVATDYCVKLAVLGLLKRGYNVSLVTDATKAITKEGEEKALKAMKDAGAVFITTEDIITE